MDAANDATSTELRDMTELMIEQLRQAAYDEGYTDGLAASSERVTFAPHCAARQLGEQREFGIPTERVCRPVVILAEQDVDQPS